MKLFMHPGPDGKNMLKTAILNIFVDPENGFLKLSLTDEDGGVLYVPGGEGVTPIMGNIIENSRGSIFVIGQDYHPETHISFMPNHPGIMEYRMEKFKELLMQHGQAIPDHDTLYKQCQNPVHFFNGPDQPPVLFPFPEVVLDEDRNIFGLKEADGRICEVRTETSSGKAPQKNDRGRIAKVFDSYHQKTLDQYCQEGRLLSVQTLWTKHCVQGTASCLYPANLKLPLGLQQKLSGDHASKFIYHRDANTDNEFWVIRKGMDPELDSYGIGVENDGETMTVGFDVFHDIGCRLKELGCQQVLINGGGLATNFCVEFSMNNVADFLAGHFKMRGMKVQINFVPEISRGIPIPGGPDVPFSLDGTQGRLAERGIGTTTVDGILALSAKTTAAKPLYQAPRPEAQPVA